MEKSYSRRFENIRNEIAGTAIRQRSRQPGAKGKPFSRDRKMPLKDILTSSLSKKGLTNVMELRNYFREKGSKVEITKQGYLQQRKKLNPDVFTYLNDEYVKDFYQAGEAELWNGYLLLAIDGSKAEVPNSQENREHFGSSGNQKASGPARAMVSCAYDILNGFYLSMEIGHIRSSEIALAQKNLEHLEELGIEQPVLVIFDRGYPSLECIDFLESRGMHYIFRLSSKDYKAERKEVQGNDAEIVLKHTKPRLEGISKKHPEKYAHMREKKETRTRFIRGSLPAGTELALITNLPARFSRDDLLALYHQRWEIEKKYHTLKNKIKFESVTGRASIYVYQDFRSQLLVYNMVQDIRRCADAEVSRTGVKKGLKHPLRTNENIAVGLFKEQMIKIILEESPQRQADLLYQMQREMERFVLPIRISPNRERHKNLSNKYKNNLKHSF